MSGRRARVEAARCDWPQQQAQQQRDVGPEVFREAVRRSGPAPVRRVRAAAVVVLVVGAAAGCAGGASTPEEAFVAEIRAAGIWPMDNAETLLANEPCGLLEHAYRRDGVLGIVEAIGWQDDGGAYLGEFLIYAGAAVEHLCPDLREPWRAAVDLYGDGEFTP